MIIPSELYTFADFWAKLLSVITFADVVQQNAVNLKQLCSFPDAAS
jgi:hypothetical protein